MDKQVLAPSVRSTAIASLPTVGSIIIIGKIVSNLLQQTIGKVGIEVRNTIEQLNNDVNATIQNLSQIYQDNLNITLSSLDASISNKLLELEALFNRINKALQEDIELIKDATKDIIHEAGKEVRRTISELEKSLQNVIIVGGETIAYVLDRAIYNIVLVVSLVMFGIGLILFAVFMIKYGLPGGLPGVLIFTFMIIFLALFGVLTIVPKVRTYVMTFTGIGLKARLEKIIEEPRILEIIPGTIILTQTQEVEVWGNALLPKDKVLKVKIAGQILEPIAVGPEHIVVNVANLTAPKGSTNLVLMYGDVAGPQDIIKIERLAPPVELADLTITDFALYPASPEQGENVQARITVQNQGRGNAGPFVLRWHPYAAHPGLSSNAVGLNTGESREFPFTFAYTTSGDFDSLANVDILNQVDETVETNNRAVVHFTVRPRQPRLIVSSIFTVKEKDSDVDTGIVLAIGDRLRIDAWGDIWAGHLLYGRNGPEGFHWTDNDSKYPLPGSYPYALLYKLNQKYVYVGKNYDAIVYDAGRLYLRINDDTPGNGNGQFECQIQVWR